MAETAEIAMVIAKVTAAMGFTGHDPMALRLRCGGVVRVAGFVL